MRSRGPESPHPSGGRQDRQSAVLPAPRSTANKRHSCSPVGRCSTFDRQHDDAAGALEDGHRKSGDAEQFQQSAEFPLLCKVSLGPFAVTVLPIALASKAAATACAAVQSTASFFRRWRTAGMRLRSTSEPPS
jgi:hypothetical protein